MQLPMYLFRKRSLLALIPPLIVLACHFMIVSGFHDNLYVLYPWIDIPMHFLGGTSIFLMTYIFLHENQDIGDVFYRLPSLVQLVLFVALVSLVATGWEFYEFGVDYLFRRRFQLSLPDTMLDMFLGLAGAAIPAVLIILHRRSAAIRSG